MKWKSDETIDTDYTYQFWGSRNIQSISHSISFDYGGIHYTIEYEGS
jgi:hypothetical protein